MIYETNKYNLLYGKILAITKNANTASAITISLYNAGVNLNLSNSELLSYINSYGIHYQNQNVYDQLNKSRSASSQIGFIESPHL